MSLKSYIWIDSSCDKDESRVLPQSESQLLSVKIITHIICSSRSDNWAYGRLHIMSFRFIYTICSSQSDSLSYGRLHINPDSKVHGANGGAHLGPTGPRWAPRWPHELRHLGSHSAILPAKLSLSVDEWKFNWWPIDMHVYQYEINQNRWKSVLNRCIIYSQYELNDKCAYCQS